MRVTLLHNPKAGDGVAAEPFSETNSRLEQFAASFRRQIWPRKKPKARRPGKIEITVKPSALVILQPAR